MSEDQDKVLTLKVRVTPELKQAILDSAHANNRSMNAEIVYHIQNGLNQKQDSRNSDINKALNVMVGRKLPPIAVSDLTERKRLARIAALAVMHALEQDTTEVDVNKKAP